MRATTGTDQHQSSTLIAALILSFERGPESISVFDRNSMKKTNKKALRTARAPAGLLFLFFFFPVDMANSLGTGPERCPRLYRILSWSISRPADVYAHRPDKRGWDRVAALGAANSSQAGIFASWSPRGHSHVTSAAGPRPRQPKPPHAPAANRPVTGRAPPQSTPGTRTLAPAPIISR